MKASIAQKDEQFVPHVVAVTAGSSVSFPNEDPFFHNVFSLSRGATFDLGRYPVRRQSRAQVFTQPGIVKVFCHIHSHMSAVIRVFDHPWFTIPDDQGTFTIDGVPPGEHTLVAWHERIGERRDRVTIRAGARPPRSPSRCRCWSRPSESAAAGHARAGVVVPDGGARARRGLRDAEPSRPRAGPAVGGRQPRVGAAGVHARRSAPAAGRAGRGGHAGGESRRSRRRSTSG